jgi:hypothetical protein
VISQGPQACQHDTCNFVFDVTMYYINPNAPMDTCGLTFTIGGQNYISNSQLLTKDINDLGTMSGMIVLLSDHFDAVTIGYHIPQRCDCDSSYFNSSYSPTFLTLPNAVPTVNTFSVVEVVDGKTYYANSTAMLQKMIVTQISTAKFIQKN